MSAIVLGASLFAMPPLTDVANGAAARGAHLVMPISYLALAPICDALDTISLFSQRQHFAFLATCALCYAAWRVMRRRRALARHRRVGKESLMSALALLALITLYAAGTLLPRPVAKLAVTSPTAIVVDFHSHTSFSWDGRADFTPQANRRWHQASGVDAAYVTDHGTFEGAVEAARNNPARAGDGTVLLSGIEVRSMGRHLDILGTDARDSGAYTADDLDENGFVQKVRTRTAVPPIVLLTLPGNINPPAAAIPIDAIEISDGAPRALAQIDAQRQKILDLARRDRVVMVAGSNNHGWARAVPAWSVMEIAGWRSMSPSQLDSAIRQTMFQRGYGAVRVIERRAPGPTSYTALALTVPLAVWRMLATMSWAERMGWLSWIWIGYILVRAGTWTFARRRNHLYRRGDYPRAQVASSNSG